MLLDEAFTRDDLLCGSKEVTTYIFLGSYVSDLTFTLTHSPVHL
jgi:hypothetical protein